jgi:hypothetical protein
MQWILYICISHAGWYNMLEHVMLCLPVISLPVALSADVSGNLGAVICMLIRGNNPCPDINAEVLVSRMYYSMRMLLSPLM